MRIHFYCTPGLWCSFLEIFIICATPCNDILPSFSTPLGGYVYLIPACSLNKIKSFNLALLPWWGDRHNLSTDPTQSRKLWMMHYTDAQRRCITKSTRVHVHIIKQMNTWGKIDVTVHHTKFPTLGCVFSPSPRCEKSPFASPPCNRGPGLCPRSFATLSLWIHESWNPLIL